MANQIYLTESNFCKFFKKATGKKEIIAAKKSYHGSTQGALSVLGVNKQKKN